MASYTVAVVGNWGVGKTSFIERHATGQFYNYPTQRPKTILTFTTNHGKINLTVLESPKPESQFDAAIIMFDVCRMTSYNSVPKWYEMVKHVPFVICGNMVDVKTKQVTSSDITIHTQLGCPFYYLSAKSNYDIEKPFLAILRQLTGKDDLVFE